MANILLTNDDGYNSVGFLPLLKELSKEFSVVTVAPTKEMSWIGKSITTKQELELKKIKLGKFNIFTLNGTPADCVQVGLYDVAEKRPTLVVSGINIGENIGYGRILSSGTVGAAMEASIDGVKAISSSLYIPPEIKKKTNFFDPKNHLMFENAAKITLKVIKILNKKKLGKNVDLVSVNIPYKATIDSDFEITKPFRSPYGRLFHKKKDRYIHINPTIEFKNMKNGTDLKVLSEGKISITPISLELVSKETFSKFDKIIRKEW